LKLKQALAVLREVLDRPGLHITRPMLNLKWRDAFETFFRVMPESAADEDVFIDILDTFSLCLRRSIHSFDNINDIALFQWLLYIVTNERHVFWVLFQASSFQNTIH